MCCSHRQAALPRSASWEHKSTYGVYGQQVISRHLGTTQLSYPTPCHGKHNLGMPWAALPFMKQWSRQSQQHISTWWAHKAGAAQVTCSVLSPHQHPGDTALRAHCSQTAQHFPPLLTKFCAQLWSKINPRNSSCLPTRACHEHMLGQLKRQQLTLGKSSMFPVLFFARNRRWEFHEEGIYSLLTFLAYLWQSWVMKDTLTQSYMGNGFFPP